MNFPLYKLAWYLRWTKATVHFAATIDFIVHRKRRAVRTQCEDALETTRAAPPTHPESRATR